jgi:hypothetical protein
VLLAGSLALLLVVAGGYLVLRAQSESGSDGDDGSAVAAPGMTRAEWTATQTGVFRRTDAAAVDDFEEWLGRRIDVVVDMPARGNWSQISSPDYLLEEWQDSGRTLVLGVAMLPTDVEGVSIQDGARGEYDQYFRTLGEKLVEYGLEDSILRIGWEFNLSTWPWSTEDADAWQDYFRRVVDALRQADGQRFLVDWNVNNGRGGPDAVDYYPGDEYVDFIGVDAYDVAGAADAYPIPEGCTDVCAQERRERAWRDYIYGGERGLQFWSDFAAEHDKQMSLPEWGVWQRFDGTGGGDNPYYIEQMAAFIADPDNRVAYQAYFEDANEQGSHRLMTDFPESADRYRELISG